MLGQAGQFEVGGGGGVEEGGGGTLLQDKHS